MFVGAVALLFKWFFRVLRHSRSTKLPPAEKNDREKESEDALRRVTKPKLIIYSEMVTSERHILKCATRENVFCCVGHSDRTVMAIDLNIRRWMRPSGLASMPDPRLLEQTSYCWPFSSEFRFFSSTIYCLHIGWKKGRHLFPMKTLWNP